MTEDDSGAVFDLISNLIPSSIGLYQPGQDYPKSDQKKTDEDFRKVNDKVTNLIDDIVRKWTWPEFEGSAEVRVQSDG